MIDLAKGPLHKIEDDLSNGIVSLIVRTFAQIELYLEKWAAFEEWDES